MAMVILGTMTGEENLKQAHCKVHCFHSPIASQRGMKETYLTQVAKTNNELVRKVGVPTIVDAVAGVIPDIGGKWTTQNFEVQEGQIVKLFASRKTSWNGVLKQGSVFLQMRPQAALHVVRVKLLQVSGQTRVPFAEFTGRFDVITLNDALAAGCYVNPKFFHLFNESSIGGLFEVEVKEAEIKTRTQVENKVVQTESGERKVFQAPVKGRNIQL